MERGDPIVCTVMPHLVVKPRVCSLFQSRNIVLPLLFAARGQLFTQCRTGTSELVAPARRAAGRLTFKGNETHGFDLGGSGKAHA